MDRLSYRGNVATALQRMLMLLAALTVAGLVVVQFAAAEATVGPKAAAGPQGLPEGRVYEEVSPANKFGAEALPFERPSFTSPNGNAVMYEASGAVIEGATNSSLRPMFVSERTSHGWTTRAAMPLPAEGEEGPEQYLLLNFLDLAVPSADLSHLLFASSAFSPYVGPPDELGLGNNLYLIGSNPFAEPEWIGRSQISGAPGGLAPGVGKMSVAGASPDLKTIYFYYQGALFPGASHMYEYKDGVLSDAGVLPGGEVSSQEAYPAADPKGNLEISPAALDNQVSADGSHLFFIRDDEKETLELYAHVTASDGSQRTILVSQSQLSGHSGEPAPHGPAAMASTEWRASTYNVAGKHEAAPPSYVFASPDGSHAFFQSTDRLTASAPENSVAKTYDFDLETETLEYIPSITGSIVTVTEDGSSLMFENSATSPAQLEWWTAGPSGGTAKTVAKLPRESGDVCGEMVCVGPAFMSNDGSVVVFGTESTIPGFNDGGTHRGFDFIVHAEEEDHEEAASPNSEVFRYDVKHDELDCLSCPPDGVTPSSNGTISKLAEQLNIGGTIILQTLGITTGRPMSSDGEVVFFETREALVPQDTNGTGDVYEWRAGKLYLITSGHDPRWSFLTGTSESGGDAFFMTTEGIAPGDVDDSYDVYDARVPRPGDNPPPEAVPCTGAVCQGPPSVPELFGQPASAAFNGAENMVTPAPSHVSSKALTRAQRLARALKSCRRVRSLRKRKLCERQARRKYGAASARTSHAAKQAGHRNGRGK